MVIEGGASVPVEQGVEHPIRHPWILRAASHGEGLRGMTGMRAWMDPEHVHYMVCLDMHLRGYLATACLPICEDCAIVTDEVRRLS